MLLQQQRMKRKKDTIISENKKALFEKEHELLKLEKQRVEEDLISSKKLLDNYNP